MYKSEKLPETIMLLPGPPRDTKQNYEADTL